MIILRSYIFLCLTLLSSTYSYAHTKDEDYIYISIKNGAIEGEFHVNVDDISKVDGVPAVNADLPVAEYGESVEIALKKYLAANFFIGAGAEVYSMQFSDLSILREKGDFMVVPFVITEDNIPDLLTIEHNLFHDQNPSHRGLVLVRTVEQTNSDYGREHTALIFGPKNTVQQLDLNAIPSLISRTGMIYQGVLHIWAGYDHILFLLALVLPIVLVSNGKQRIPVEHFSSAFRRLLGIVTVFTVAHSITLLLAMLDLVSVNARIVESVIALSIALAALNNIYHWVNRGTLWIVLLLGLFHGLGFASVMAELPFRMKDLAGMVLRFNVGVELGQIAIVSCLFPLLYIVRRRSFYQPVVLRGLSWVLVLISAVWLYQRAVI